MAAGLAFGIEVADWIVLPVADIYQGKLCGMCHDNRIAWGLENCDLCHSGRAGLKSGIQGGHKTLGPGRW